MADIVVSVHCRRLGLDKDGNLVIAGTGLVFGHDTGADTKIAASDLGSIQASSREVAAGATLSLTQAAHDGKTIALDTAAGSVVTLPAATGSGAKFKFYVKTLATSNSHVIQVANATDFFVGLVSGARIDSGNAVLGFAAANSGTVATNSDTITLNRTTTGSVSKGEWIEVEDVLAATWAVKGFLSATGAAFATPFSAAV